MTRRNDQRLADIEAAIAGMRERLTHRYFDTSHAIVTATVAEDLPDLERAVARLRARAAEL